MLSLQAHNLALLWWKVIGNMPICTFSSCLNYLVKPLACELWQYHPERLIMQHNAPERQSETEPGTYPLLATQLDKLKLVKLRIAIFSREAKFK